jgi:hypothetical protein
MAPLLLPNSYIEIGVKVASNFEHEMFASLKTTVTHLEFSYCEIN